MASLLKAAILYLLIRCLGQTSCTGSSLLIQKKICDGYQHSRVSSIHLSLSLIPKTSKHHMFSRQWYEIYLVTIDMETSRKKKKKFPCSHDSSNGLQLTWAHSFLFPWASPWQLERHRYDIRRQIKKCSLWDAVLQSSGNEFDWLIFILCLGRIGNCKIVKWNFSVWKCSFRFVVQFIGNTEAIWVACRSSVMHILYLSIKYLISHRVYASPSVTWMFHFWAISP